MKSIKENKKEFTIWGSGSPIREWVYMEDVAKIIKIIIDDERDGLPNPINIGQNYGFSIKESVNMIQKILNTDFKLNYDLTKKEGAPKKVMSDKLFRKYFPNFKYIKPEEGIKNTIKYYNKFYR